MSVKKTPEHGSYVPIYYHSSSSISQCCHGTGAILCHWPYFERKHWISAWKEICQEKDLTNQKKNPNFPYLHPHYMDSLDPLDPLCFEEAWFPQCDIHLPSVCIEDFLMQLGFLKLQWLGEWLVPVWKWLLNAILQLLFSPFYKIPLRLISERDKEGHREDLRSFQHCIQYWWL